MVAAGLSKKGVPFQRWDGHLIVLCLSRDSCWLLEQKYLLNTDIVPGTLSKKNSLRVATWFSHVMKKLGFLMGAQSQESTQPAQRDTEQ